MQQPSSPQDALPDPEEAGRQGLPPHRRWPLHGKMQPPTVPPMPSPFRAAKAARAVQKRRSRRGYLLGLLVGQIFIVGLIFGGQAIVDYAGVGKIDLPVRLLVFACVVGGIALTGALIVLLLLLQGLAYVVRPGGKPFGRALWNGLRRVARAGLSLGLCLAVLGGTAAATVPHDQWVPSGKQLWERGKKEVKKLQERGKKRPLTSPS